MDTRPDARPWAQLLFAGWLLGVGVPLLVGQGLAFGRGFTVARTLALSVALLPWLAWRYLKDGLPVGPAPRVAARGLRTALLGLAALLWALVVLPVALWPRTALGGFLGGTIAWDVVYYHLPKAVDVLQTRGMWNLTVPYGQYPVGWEILLALSVGIGRSAEGLGPAAGVALGGFLLACLVLLQRETGWPTAWGAVLVGGMTFSFYVPMPNNPWREFGRVVHYTSGIGKNDVLAAALLLAVLVHLPLSRDPARRRWHPTGVGLSLAAALAVKPHVGLLALALVGGTWLWLRPRPTARTALAWLGAAMVGSLWMARNLVLMGRLFSPVASLLARRALVRVLPEPAFWQSGPKTWLLVTAALLVGTAWAWRRPSWRAPVAAAWVLYAGFLVTPAGVQPRGPRWHVAWRLGLALLAWVWTLLWAGLAEVSERRVRWIWSGRWAGRFACALALAATLALGLREGHRLRVEPEHAWILYDPFPHAVGTRGYYSVFDYLHRSLRGATVEFDGAPPWYVYDPALTHRAVRPGHYPGGLPAAVPQPRPDHWLFCAAEWQPHGRVTDPDAVRAQVARWQAQGWTVLYADSACALARAEPLSPASGSLP